jgi:putative two-component system protein, hydrogenase maturation factor HypX/HoxX
VRILFLTRSFNSLTQRLYLDLIARGHQVAVEFDIADSVAIEAAALFKPDLVLAPYLTRAIPEALWRHHLCLVVHPGVPGDRGPSALDWAIHDGEQHWGVTVLQATAEMDAGPVWAYERFVMREASKSSLYRHEVTEAAVAAVARAVQHLQQHGAVPPLQPPEAQPGCWRPLMRQSDRAIDWQHDGTAQLLRKLRAADGSPGVLDELFGTPCHLFDGQAEATPLPPGSEPGTVVARCDGALLRATVDGAVWIGHVRRSDGPHLFKLPATLAFAQACAELPTWPLAALPASAPSPAAPAASADGRGRHGRDIRLSAADGVVSLHFPFYNGAMGTAQCLRLRDAVREALARPEPVLVLHGGPDFWSNGIHLNLIEAAESPADESWRNIVAMDDLAQTLIEESTQRLVVAAMRGNAGAGGVFLALAADEVWAREGIVLNPHYKNMGNLHGSEYWTYLLPRRVRHGDPRRVLDQRLPVSAQQARELGLVDRVFSETGPAFVQVVQQRAAALAADPGLGRRLAAKAAQRQADEARKPLARYREAELAAMRRNFYGFDPSYHVARAHFVMRKPASWTPRHLAVHRDAAPAGPQTD